jgi:hypothetical protein
MFIYRQKPLPGAARAFERRKTNGIIEWNLRICVPHCGPFVKK